MTSIMEAKPEEVELFVLSALRTTESVQRAITAGLNDESWQVDAHAKAWEYILKRVKEAGEPPSLGDASAACGVALIKDVTDDETFLAELVKRTIERQAISRIIGVDDLMRTDPKKAVEKLIGDLSEISSSVTAHSRYFDADSNDRLERVLARKDKASRGEVIGIRTGLPTLDGQGYNFHPGEMIGIQGPMNVGKSTLLTWLCAHAYHFDAARVLFLTPESTISDIEDRLDPMIGHFMGYDFSNLAIRRGLVDEDTYRQYMGEIALGERHDWVTRDSGDLGVFSVGEIIHLTREHRPNVLAIDGVHLISGEGRSWERIKDAAEALKGLAQHQGLVIIGGTQVQRDAVMAADDPASLGQSAYGLAFLEACDKVISLAEKRGDPLQRVWKLQKNRSGQKIEHRQYLRFDVDRGIIGEIIVRVDETTGIANFD